MEDLTEQEAIIIHNIILNHGNTDLINVYTERLKAHAKMREGMGAMTMAWKGTPLSENMQYQLKKVFSHIIKAQTSFPENNTSSDTLDDKTKAALKEWLYNYMEVLEEKLEQETHEQTEKELVIDFLENDLDWPTLSTIAQTHLFEVYEKYIQTETPQPTPRIDNALEMGLAAHLSYICEELALIYLQNRNLLSFDASLIELDTLASALPDEIIAPHFHHDPKEEAAKINVDYEDFKENVKTAYRGTVGTPGQDDFGILLSADIGDDFHIYACIVGLSMLMNPYGKETVDRLNQKSADDDGLRTTFSNMVKQGQDTYDQGIDAKSVYIVTTERSPLAIRLLSEILDLPETPPSIEPNPQH